MDFQLTEEPVRLKQAVRRLAESEFRPRAAHWDEHEAFPWDNVPLLRDEGLLGLARPEAYGGSGGDVFDLALVMEELARCCVATAFGARAIALFGANLFLVYRGAWREFPVERMLRDARGLCIDDGTTQIQKNIIAEHVDRGR